MKVKLHGKVCRVIREEGDPKLNAGFAGNESLLLHRVKVQLNQEGFDFIKKRMHKDGHMVDEFQQYLRERKVVKTMVSRDSGKKRVEFIGQKRQLAIYNPNYAIEDAGTTFERDGAVQLYVADLAPTQIFIE